MNVVINNISELTTIIEETHRFFLSLVQKQVNTALTLRNWLIGFYIVEFEQSGNATAQYGKNVIENLSIRLKEKNLKGFSEIALRTDRAFYLAYPQIQQTVSVELHKSDSKLIIIQQTMSVESQIQISSENRTHKTNAFLLLNRLSFSHFIELLKVEELTKREYYEVEVIKNNWTVRELQRAIHSMVYERTGLSTNKNDFSLKLLKNEKIEYQSIFRNPLLLEFLEIEEKYEYSESDLEQAIINHLQKFLMELGIGFCFESRQKRITFDNTHYRIDLVFYHRILKCHILLDLKLGEFTHADSGQMNVYLNYFKENEMQEGDNPPIGIILCASQNENLVKFATSGLSNQIFVSKYLIRLPKEEDLKKIIQEEQEKLQSKLFSNFIEK